MLLINFQRLQIIHLIKYKLISDSENLKGLNVIYFIRKRKLKHIFR